MTSFSLFTLMHWRRKWQPPPVFLPGESQGRGCLMGCRLWGCTESDTTEVTWQQQQQWQFIYIMWQNHHKGKRNKTQYSNSAYTLGICLEWSIKNIVIGCVLFLKLGNEFYYDLHSLYILNILHNLLYVSNIS